MNVSVLIVFFSFFVLGTILTFTITNYWSSEKLNLLDVRAKNVASYMKGYLAVNEPLDDNYRPTFTLNKYEDIERFLSFFAGEVNGDIAITTTKGVTQMAVNAADSANKLPLIGQRFEEESSRNES